MPKYFQDKVAGYYLYYTKHCIIECMLMQVTDGLLRQVRQNSL